MIKEIELFFQNAKTKRIDIVSGRHTTGIAVMLQKMLYKKGYQSKIYSSPPLITSDRLFVVFAPQIYSRLPLHYCVYQVEQLTYDHWNTATYKTILENAVAVFEYSRINFDYLKQFERIRSKLYYLPFDVNQDVLLKTAYVEDKKYDVLFYGATSSERRKDYFSAIREKCELKVINDKFGKKLQKELNRAHIIVNIHYKDNAILETCRLSEGLSLGNSVIISEDSIDRELDKQFSPYIEFVPQGNHDAMVDRIMALLNRKEQISEIVEQNRIHLLQRENLFTKYAEDFF